MTREPDNFDELEHALRDLPLRQPSAELDGRLRRKLITPSPRRWYIGAAITGMAAAAAVLLVFWIQTGTPGSTGNIAITPDKSATVAQANEQWLDEGIIGYASDGPVRQYRIVDQFASAAGQMRTMEEVVQVVAETY